MKLTKKMIKEFESEIKDWCEDAEETDPEMIKAYEDDREDLEYIRDLMVEGDYDYAAQRAGDLDTVVRDQIPEAIWDFLQDYV